MDSIHVGLNYNSALSSKKQVLLSEMSLLNIMKHIKNYKSLKKREFTLKNKIKKDLASIRIAISKIQDEFPKDTELKKPEKSFTQEIGEETEEPIIEKKTKEIKGEEREDSHIDMELRKIREKLSRLE